MSRETYRTRTYSAIAERLRAERVNLTHPINTHRNQEVQPMETITDVARFATEAAERYGYADASAVTLAAHTALNQGLDLVLYTNHDLGSLGSRPLASIQTIARDAETPPHAGDTDYIGLGWRYLPELRLTAVIPDEVK